MPRSGAAIAWRLAEILVASLILPANGMNEECAPCDHGRCRANTCRCSGSWQGARCDDDSMRDHPLTYGYIVYESFIRFPVLLWTVRVMWQRHGKDHLKTNAADAACLGVAGMATFPLLQLYLNPMMDDSRYDCSLWLTHWLLFIAYLISGAICYFLVLHSWRVGITTYTPLARQDVFLRILLANAVSILGVVVLLCIPTTWEIGLWAVVAISSIISVSCFFMFTVYGGSVIQTLEQVRAMDAAAARLQKRVRLFRTFYLLGFIPLLVIPGLLYVLDPYPVGARFLMYKFLPSGVNYFTWLIVLYMQSVERDRRRFFNSSKATPMPSVKPSSHHLALVHSLSAALRRPSVGSVAPKRAAVATAATASTTPTQSAGTTLTPTSSQAMSGPCNA